MLLLACLTLQDVLNARCDVACHLGGWSEGYERDGFCICADKIPSDRLTKQKLNLPKRIPHKPKEDS